jgi:hypothetical protein
LPIQAMHSGGSSEQPDGNCEGDAQVATKASSAPLSGDLRKMIAQGEDEQHSDKIGLPGIQDLKKGNGGAGWRAFLDIDDDSVSQMTSYYFAKLISDHPDDRDYLPPYEPQQLTEVYERLALYRIRGYQVSLTPRQ